MARLVTKRKGYNAYINYIHFTGYGLDIEFRATVTTVNGEGKAESVRLTLTQTATQAGAEFFFANKELNVPANVEAKVGFRLIRSLSEKLVQADFNVEKITLRHELSGGALPKSTESRSRRKRRF